MECVFTKFLNISCRFILNINCKRVFTGGHTVVRANTKKSIDFIFWLASVQSLAASTFKGDVSSENYPLC